MLRLIKFIVILCVIFYGCNYPDIDDIPEADDLKITYEDKKNLKKLKEEINE